MFDRSDAIRTVQNAEHESALLLRQIHVWLALGASGGAVTIFTLAVSSSNPDYTMRFFQYSLWAFLFAVTSAGVSVLLLSLRLSKCAGHIAHANNREEFKDLIKSMPFVLSSPQRIADEANAERNKLVNMHDAEHENAEKYYFVYQIYKWLWRLCLCISVGSFIAGFSAPLIQVTILEQSLIAPTVSTKNQ